MLTLIVKSLSFFPLVLKQVNAAVVATIFTINVGIGTYFVHFHWYIDVTRVTFGIHTQTTI